MHPLLLACAALLCPAPQGEASSSEAFLDAGPFAVHLEETRLVAVNRSFEPFVLVLASPGRGSLVARTVQPGAILVTTHPPHALTGIWLEVLTAPAGRLATSGGLALDGRRQTLVFGWSAGAGLDGALAIHAERALTRGPSFLPAAHQPSELAPMHVPIPEPRDKPPGNRPPPVEKEPLPPV